MPWLYLACSTLDSAADKCGPSGCGELVLQASGNTYFTVAASKTLPSSQWQEPPPTADLPPGQYNICNVSINFTSAGADTSKAKRSHPESVLSERLGGHRQPAGKHAYLGFVLVYSGPMTITSKTHETKWKEGWFDLAVPFCPEGWPRLPVSDIPSNVPYVDPEDFWTYKLAFDKPQETARDKYGTDEDDTEEDTT